MAQARAQTEIEAANLALARVRQPPIGDFAEGNTRARVTGREFGGVRDSVLAEHHWNFASDWIVPAAGAAPASGPWTKRYPLPENVITVRRVRTATSGDIGVDSWALETAPSGEVKALLTGTDAPLLNVTIRIDSPRLWDPLFLDVFVLRLAARIAPPILKSNSLADKLDAKADEKIGLAKRLDAREAAPSEITRTTSWITARRA